MVLEDVQSHVDRIRDDWDDSIDPASHFDALENAIITLANEIYPEKKDDIVNELQMAILVAVSEMEDDYQAPEEEDAPVSSETSSSSEFEAIFSDVDE
ncbi:hypothetical protein WK78_13220 [Burkholderia cepacia]|nr:hypothetical protein WK78_13220 [Burkholderia cepacia]